MKICFQKAGGSCPVAQQLYLVFFRTNSLAFIISRTLTCGLLLTADQTWLPLVKWVSWQGEVVFQMGEFPV